MQEIYISASIFLKVQKEQKEMKQILLECLPDETAMAVLNDGVLTEFEVERPHETSLVGRIYAGTVKNSVPSLKGLFIDIGEKKNAFLRLNNWPQYRKKPTVGMSVLVQVIKDSTDTKGPLVSGEVSLPGRYAVLVANTDYIGVSRKIEEEAERMRLKQLGEACCPEGCGLIIRTAAREGNEEAVKREFMHLASTWKIIERRLRIEKAPVLLYRGSDLVVRCLRDYADRETEIIVDDAETEKRLLSVNQSEQVVKSENIHRYEGAVPIMKRYGAADSIQQLFERQVNLPSGGSIVIDYTEALTAIDVNSGSFHAKGMPHGEVAYLINKEAVPEIARQIRIRGIGGIIMIDFIDMDHDWQKENIVKRLREAVSSDKVKTVVCGMTSLGLVEMTRKRTAYRLEHVYYDTCPCCKGSGLSVSAESVVIRIHRELKMRRKMGNFQSSLRIECHPAVARRLQKEEEQHRLHTCFHVKPIIKAREDMAIEVFSILSE